MPGPAVRTVVLSPSTSKTATATETGFVVFPAAAIGAIILLECTGGGTNSPALTVTIQQGILGIAAGDTSAGKDTSGSYTWDDAYSFATVTLSVTSRILRLGTTTSNTERTASANALGQSVLTGGPLGDAFRVSWQMTGSAVTFAVVGKFFFPS